VGVVAVAGAAATVAATVATVEIAGKQALLV
jgi:hypothetical protein